MTERPPSAFDGCPSHDTLLSLVEGGSSTGVDAARAHLEGCPPCLAVLADLAAAPDDTDTAAWERRYEICEQLGEGASGRVCRAWDSKLERNVALKFYRSGNEARALAEARILAQLHHRNLVGVYDVGEIDAGPYVAMELLVGDNLREWLRVGRTTRVVTRALHQAACGLSAAHAAGVVHRDFKPDNVVVQTSGRVVVVDFGLALNSGADASGVGVAGSPAYMAPELMRRTEPSRSSDVFAFCVSAYEAYCARRPFPGRSTRSVIRAIADRPASLSWSDVPRRLRALVERGLHHDPARRPSMAELTAALAPRRHRAKVALVALVVGAAATSVGFAAADSAVEPSGVCELASEVALVRRQLGAEPSSQALRSQLDAIESQGEASCEHPDLSGTARIVHASCLRSRLAQVREAVAVRRTDPTAAVEAALSSVATCAEEETLALEFPLPAHATPDDLSAIGEVRQQLAVVEFLQTLARGESAREILKDLRAAEIVERFPALEAEIMLAAAGVELLDSGPDPATRRRHLDTVASAARSGHRWVEAMAWVDLLQWELYYERDRALEVLPLARAGVGRLGAHARRPRFFLASVEAELFTALGDDAKALAASERVVSLATSAEARLLARWNTANALQRSGFFAEALGQLETMITEAEAAPGKAVYIRFELAVLLARMGDAQRALRELDTALDQAIEASVGRALTRTVVSAAGRIAASAGEPQRALGHLAAARSLGAPSSQFARALEWCARAQAARDLGRQADAVQAWQRAERYLDAALTEGALDALRCRALGARLEPTASIGVVTELVHAAAAEPHRLTPAELRWLDERPWLSAATKQ